MAIINNGIWNVLVASGIFAFLAIIVQEWLKVAVGRPRSETRSDRRKWPSWSSCLPASPSSRSDLSTIQFDHTAPQQCQVNVPEPSETPLVDPFTTLNNQSAPRPGLVVLHACPLQGWLLVRRWHPSPVAPTWQMRMEIDSTRIVGPTGLGRDFTRRLLRPGGLFHPARSERGNARLTRVVTFFLDGRLLRHLPVLPVAPRDALQATPAWPKSPVAGVTRIAGTGGWTAPRDCRTCLRRPQPAVPVRAMAGFMDQTQVDDALIRAIVHHNTRMNQGQVYTDYGGQWNNTAQCNHPRRLRPGPDRGITRLFPRHGRRRQALLMILSFLKMAMVICHSAGAHLRHPIALRTVVTVTAVQFALFFVDFWFQLARWVTPPSSTRLYGWESRTPTSIRCLGSITPSRHAIELRRRSSSCLDSGRCTELGRVRNGNILSGFITGTSDAKSAVKWRWSCR